MVKLQDQKCFCLKMLKRFEHFSVIMIFILNATAKAEPALIDKQFVIEGDQCAQYLIPYGQSMALVYEQEVVIDSKTMQNSTMYSERLKLPVFCQECKSTKEARVKRAKDSQTEGAKGIVVGRQSPWQSMSPSIFGKVEGNDSEQGDLGQKGKVLYSGPGFLNGSILCYSRGDNSSDGSFGVAPYYESLIEADEGSKHIYDAQKGKDAQAAMAVFQYPASRIIEQPADPDDDNEIGQAANEASKHQPNDEHVLHIWYGEQILWPLALYILNSFNTPATVSTMLATELARKYPEHCATVEASAVDGHTFTDHGAGAAKDIDESLLQAAAQSTINTKGYGCTSCGTSRNSRQPQSYSYIKVAGYDEIPTYEEFKKENIYLERHCRADRAVVEGLQGRITGSSRFNSYVELEDGVIVGEEACYSKVKNCALCGGKEPTCKICIDGFNLVDAKGQKDLVCIQEFCPTGSRLVQNYNGITFCQKCSIDYCQQCELKGQLELCYQCEGSFVIGSNGTQCVDKARDAAATDPAAIDIDYIALAYVIESPALPESPYTIASDDVERLKVLEQQDDLFFIQQAMTRIQQASEKHQKVDATIWLSRGDHFYFYCDEL